MSEDRARRLDVEFGRDILLIGELIKTARPVCYLRDMLVKLSQDRALLARMYEGVMKADPSVFRTPASQLQLSPLAAMLSLRLGKEVVVDSMPPEFTDENLARWACFNLRPVFLSELQLTQDLELPGWTKPDGWFYDQISKGKVSEEAIHVRGGWYLADCTVGADYTDGTQVYRDDPLAPVIAELREQGKVGRYDNTPAGSRFSITWEEWQGQVLAVLAGELGLDRPKLRLERAVEFNAIGNLYDPNRGKFNCWEWFEDQFRGFYRLFGGSRESGGLAIVDYVDWLSDRNGSIAARPLVSFCPPEAD